MSFRDGFEKTAVSNKWIQDKWKSGVKSRAANGERVSKNLVEMLSARGFSPLRDKKKIPDSAYENVLKDITTSRILKRLK